MPCKFQQQPFECCHKMWQNGVEFAFWAWALQSMLWKMRHARRSTKSQHTHTRSPLPRTPLSGLFSFVVDNLMYVGTRPDQPSGNTVRAGCVFPKGLITRHARCSYPPYLLPWERPFLPAIYRETLMLAAFDGPFMPIDRFPFNSLFPVSLNSCG